MGEDIADLADADDATAATVEAIEERRLPRRHSNGRVPIVGADEILRRLAEEGSGNDAPDTERIDHSRLAIVQMS